MRNTEIADKTRKRDKRKFHIRKRVEGTTARPRLTVYKSNKYMYLQAIDDVEGKTLAAASTLEESLKGVKRNLAGAAQLGEEMGKRLKEKNIAEVVFDRNGYLYHGIVKAMADGARKAGIQF
jgi:large subunit ribosomal protein L18